MKCKHILCFGDSNTWGYDAQNDCRYDDDVRWTRRLGNLLGDSYLVLEEGISGRTTVFDDPRYEGLCGKHVLATLMMTHSPLDLMIMMLGTNDCKSLFAATPKHISDGLRRMVRKAYAMRDAWAGEPCILLVAPIIMDERVSTNPRICEEMCPGSEEKSPELPTGIKQAAADLGCHYMDCNDYVVPGPGDYMHFDHDSNARFAEAVAQKVRQIVPV